MGCVVKRAVLLPLLLVAAIGSEAAPAANDCEGLKGKMLPAKDLHTVFGDWVLVWSVTDHQGSRDVLLNVSSSHIELRLLPDNKTLTLTVRNLFFDKSCHNHVVNFTMPSDPSDKHHPLLSIGTMEEKDGVVQLYNDTEVVDMFKSCPDCLTLVYNTINGRFLLSYRREGQHSDVEQLTAALSDHRKQAECLGFSHDKPFSYDGVTDFCHKKSSPEAEKEDS